MLFDQETLVMIHAFQAEETADQQERLAKRLERWVKATKQQVSRMNESHHENDDQNLKKQHWQVGWTTFKFSLHALHFLIHPAGRR